MLPKKITCLHCQSCDCYTTFRVPYVSLVDFNIEVKRLKNQIKTLKSKNKTLKEQIAELFIKKVKKFNDT